MKTVVIASNNAHKVAEIAEALTFEGWEFKSLSDLGLVSDPDETGTTFAENARIKALAAHEASGGLAALADDSGIMVDALGGAPGVYSARYASGVHEKNAQDGANNALLIANLEGVPDDRRTARYGCALCFVDEDGTMTEAYGTVEGRIGYEPQGDGGFGYDPYFWPDVFGGAKTLAEVTREEKALVSHRGNALRALKEKLGR